MRPLEPDSDPDSPPQCWLCGSRTQPPKSLTVPCVDCCDGMKLGVWVVIIPDHANLDALNETPPVFDPVGPCLCLEPESFTRLVRATMKDHLQESYLERGLRLRYHFLPLRIAIVCGLMSAFFDPENGGMPPGPSDGPHHPASKARIQARLAQQAKYQMPSEN